MTDSTNNNTEFLDKIDELGKKFKPKTLVAILDAPVLSGRTDEAAAAFYTLFTGTRRDITYALITALRKVVEPLPPKLKLQVAEEVVRMIGNTELDGFVSISLEDIK